MHKSYISSNKIAYAFKRIISEEVSFVFEVGGHAMRMIYKDSGSPCGDATNPFKHTELEFGPLECQQQMLPYLPKWSTPYRHNPQLFVDGETLLSKEQSQEARHQQLLFPTMADDIALLHGKSYGWPWYFKKNIPLRSTSPPQDVTKLFGGETR